MMIFMNLFSLSYKMSKLLRHVKIMLVKHLLWCPGKIIVTSFSIVPICRCYCMVNLYLTFILIILWVLWGGNQETTLLGLLLLGRVSLVKFATALSCIHKLLQILYLLFAIEATHCQLALLFLLWGLKLGLSSGLHSKHFYSLSYLTGCVRVCVCFFTIPLAYLKVQNSKHFLKWFFPLTSHHFILKVLVVRYV